MLSGEGELLELAHCFDAARVAHAFRHLQVIDARLARRLTHVCQLLHGLAAHVLQLAHMVVHAWNLNLACRPRATCLHTTSSSDIRLRRFLSQRLQMLRNALLQPLRRSCMFMILQRAKCCSSIARRHACKACTQGARHAQHAMAATAARTATTKPSEIACRM